MARRNVTRARVETTDGIAYDLLAREVIRSSDFQSLLNRLADQVRRDVFQELLRQPLRDAGTALGGVIQDNLFGSDAARFSPSSSQVGAALRDLIEGAESIV